MKQWHKKGKIKVTLVLLLEATKQAKAIPSIIIYIIPCFAIRGWDTIRQLL